MAFLRKSRISLAAPCCEAETEIWTEPRALEAPSDGEPGTARALIPSDARASTITLARSRLGADPMMTSLFSTTDSPETLRPPAQASSATLSLKSSSRLFSRSATFNKHWKLMGWSIDLIPHQCSLPIAQQSRRAVRSKLNDVTFAHALALIGTRRMRR